MSPLATTIYRRLRAQLTKREPPITYGALAASLDLHPRSPAFHAALGEVAHVCRHRGLPCLPALVWRADTRRPSDGYFAVAHPRAHGDVARIAAWEREHDAVLRAAGRYPPRLS
jgi:hypothetical protein